MIKELTKKKIVIIGIVSFVIMIIAWIGIYFLRGTKRSDTVYLDKGWTLKINDRTVYDVNIDSYYFSGLKRLDVIEVSRQIEEDLGDRIMARLRVHYSSVEVFVNGEKIYSFGTEEVKRNVFLGSGYCYVELPKDIQGKTLTVRYIANEKNATIDIGRIGFSTPADARRIFANANATSVYLNAFIMVFGLALIVLSLMVRLYDQDSFSLFLIGVFSLLIGNWSNCQGKIYEIFSEDLTRLSVFEYVSLYSAPIPLGIFIWRRFKRVGGWRESVIKLSTLTLAIVDLLACLLHFTNLMRFPDTLTVFQLICGLCLLGVLVASTFKIKYDNISDIVVALAFFEVMISGVLDLIRLNIQRILLPYNDTVTEVSFLPLGVLLFVTNIISSYLFSLYEKILDNAEKDALTKLAYQDPLTGLYNRTKAKERFEEIDSQDSPVALVNFDVNGLKYVNDHFGHEEGDVLLKTVASVIEENFGSIGTNYRMGGDEFLCVVDPSGLFAIGRAANKLDADLKEASRNNKYIFSVSYGVAYKRKGEARCIQDVYAEADENMYAMKALSPYSREAMEDN